MSAWLLVMIRLQSWKIASLNISTLRVSSFLSWWMFKPARLEAVISGVVYIFPEKSLWSGFRNTLFGLRPDDSMIDFAAIPTHRFTTLCFVVKIATQFQFLTAATALSTSFPIVLVIFFSITWSWFVPFSSTADPSKLLTEPQNRGSVV